MRAWERDARAFCEAAPLLAHGARLLGDARPAVAALLLAHGARGCGEPEREAG